LIAIVSRALTSDPAARPASAGTLAQELAPFARREVWPAAPETSAPNVAELASTSMAAPVAQAPAERGAASKSSTFTDRRGAAAEGGRAAARPGPGFCGRWKGRRRRRTRTGRPG